MLIGGNDRKLMILNIDIKNPYFPKKVDVFTVIKDPIYHSTLTAVTSTAIIA